jgi:hypothetical protein
MNIFIVLRISLVRILLDQEMSYRNLKNGERLKRVMRRVVFKLEGGKGFATAHIT